MSGLVTSRLLRFPIGCRRFVNSKAALLCSAASPFSFLLRPFGPPRGCLKRLWPSAPWVDFAEGDWEGRALASRRPKPPVGYANGVTLGAKRRNKGKGKAMIAVAVLFAKEYPSLGHSILLGVAFGAFGAAPRWGTCSPWRMPSLRPRGGPEGPQPLRSKAH